MSYVCNTKKGAKTIKGIEYICELYKKSYNSVAEELGVSRQNIYSWVNNLRPIPKKHLAKLSEIFGGISEEYFQKELNEVDQIEIQQKKIRNELIEYEYEYPDTDPQTGEEVIVYETQPDQEQVYESNFLEFKKNIIKLHNTIDGTIGSKFRNGVIDSDIRLNAELSDAERLLELYEMFAGIIRKDVIRKDTIRTVLKGMKHYQGTLIISEKDVLEISKLIKQIEKKHEF